MGCRVMIVDDDPSIRAVLSDFIELCMEGFQVVAQATNGREAVDRAIEVDPDVILMDVRMPLLDGIGATRLIKRKHRLSAAVITATSYAWSEIRDEAFEAGADLHLKKPFDLDEVKQVLEKASLRAGMSVSAAG